MRLLQLLYQLQKEINKKLPLFSVAATNTHDNSYSEFSSEIEKMFV